MRDGDVVSLWELLEQIENNADAIYVRDQINGKWGSYALTEMPAERAITHAISFIKQRILELSASRHSACTPR